MKILFIPHSPNIKIINRVYEFAKNSDSYFLNWNIDNSSLSQKIISQFFSLSQKIALKDNIITMPLLFKPDDMAAKVNTRILNHLIQKFDIDVVVNANALLFNIEKIGVPVIYDLVDDHLEVNSDIGLTATRIEKVKQDIIASQGVICVTDELEKKVQPINPNTLVIENGLYLERFENAFSLRKELNLVDKKVFGYIGGVDRWTGIDKACASYLKIRNDSTAFIVVGDSKSKFFSDLKKTYENNIIFVGLISPDKVGNYFKTLDIGLIPFTLNEFTNNAYPIKAIEYGLAGANIISTPLHTLKKQKFPFIDFCDIDDFSKCMLHAKKKDFSFDFSNLSWQIKTNELIAFVKNNGSRQLKEV